VKISGVFIYHSQNQQQGMTCFFRYKKHSNETKIAVIVDNMKKICVDCLQFFVEVGEQIKN
jgi:hypothetical protein